MDDIWDKNSKPLPEQLIFADAIEWFMSMDYTAQQSLVRYWKGEFEPEVIKTKSKKSEKELYEEKEIGKPIDLETLNKFIIVQRPVLRLAYDKLIGIYNELESAQQFTLYTILRIVFLDQRNPQRIKMMQEDDTGPGIQKNRVSYQNDTDPGVKGREL